MLSGGAWACGGDDARATPGSVLAVRVILDTNVWTSIGERAEQTAFEALEDRLQITVVVPPPMLLEALRTPVAGPRSVRVTCKPSRSTVQM